MGRILLHFCTIKIVLKKMATKTPTTKLLLPPQQRKLSDASSQNSPKSPVKKAKLSNCGVCIRAVSTLQRGTLSPHTVQVCQSLRHASLCPMIDTIVGKYGVTYLASVQYKTTLYDEMKYCRSQNKR